MSVTPEHIRWYRMRRSGLVEPFDSPEECASALAGIQAQILPSAGLALRNRTRGMDHESFDRSLFQERTLVKIWGQRGTLHIYPSSEWSMICAARAEQPSWWRRKFESSGGDVEVFDAAVEKIERMSRKQGTLTRSELRETGLDVEGHDTDHPVGNLLSSWGGILAELVRLGYMCHAGRRNGEGLFAHRSHWLPRLEWDPPTPDDANIELARRYFHTYGPASVRDLAYWRGARMGDARDWTAALDGELTEVECSGEKLLITTGDMETLLETPQQPSRWPVRLLSRFDPFLLDHADKRWLVDMEYYDRVWRAAGHIEGTVLVKGRIAGTWRYVRKGRKLSVNVQPFEDFGKVVGRKVRIEARKVARFFGLQLV